jgi:hypothetical protein
MASSTPQEVSMEMSESAPIITITSEEKTPTMSRLSNESEGSLVEEDECLNQSYGRQHHVNDNDETTIDTCKQQQQQDEEGSSSAWELFLSLYLPLMLLGFRQSFFATANLVRSLIVLLHVVQIFFANMSEWMTEKTPWLQPLFSKGGKGTDPHAWPPAALAALAILTVVALVVHPDGFTWVMLSRTRYVSFSCLMYTRLMVMVMIPSNWRSGRFYRNEKLEIFIFSHQSCPCINFCD